MVRSRRTVAEDNVPIANLVRNARGSRRRNTTNTPPVDPTPATAEVDPTPAAPEVDPIAVANAMLQQVAAGLVRGVGTAREEPDEQRALERFMAMRPPVFTGDGDPQDAFLWLSAIEKLFEVLKFDNDRMVRFGAHMLRGGAEAWWVVNKDRLQGSMEWKEFRETFEAEFYPESYKDQKMEEFFSLKQGQSTVNEYVRTFNELSRFAPFMVTTEKARARKFQMGLRPSIHRLVAPQLLKTFREVVDAAIVVERNDNWEQQQQQQNIRKREYVGDIQHEKKGGTSSKKPHTQQSGIGNTQQKPVAKCFHCGRSHPTDGCRWITGQCFRCGSADHRIKDCPKMDNSQVVGQKDGPQHTTSLEQKMDGKKPQARARLFAITRGDAEASNAVVSEDED